MSRHALLILTLLTVTGCGTIVRGTTEEIEVRSEPRGATVRAEKCGVENRDWKTPVTLRVSRGARECRLNVSMPGYWPRTIYLSREYAPVAAVIADPQPQYETADSFATVILELILLGGSCAIDAATGASFVVLPRVLDVTLEPRNEPLTSPQRPPQGGAS